MTRLPNVMDERREVEVGDWVAALTQARAAGFTYFDWLTAVDQSDGDPGGVDVVAHLYAARAPGALAGLLVRCSGSRWWGSMMGRGSAYDRCCFQTASRGIRCGRTSC